MFQRSPTSRYPKYAVYIGDGDIKTFKGIIDVELYGNWVVKKNECIRHVQKCLGRQLRELVKKTRALEGKGKLTGKIIELLLYYELAKRRNMRFVEDMKKFHKLSMDQKPQQEKYPEAIGLWCFWLKAKARGELAEQQHIPALHKEIYVALCPVYENNNDCFNATLQSMAPKN